MTFGFGSAMHASITIRAKQGRTARFATDCGRGDFAEAAVRDRHSDEDFKKKFGGKIVRFFFEIIRPTQNQNLMNVIKLDFLLKMTYGVEETFALVT
jgi:hypothetical protein